MGCMAASLEFPTACLASVRLLSACLSACASVETRRDGSMIIRGDAAAVDRRVRGVCGAAGADVEPLVPTADPSLGTHVSSRGVAANCAGNNLCLMTMHGTPSGTTPEKSVRVVCRQG